MRSVEVEGDSIDEAIRKALVELGVTRDRASIEILKDATRGILGFGRQKARVRAAVRAPLAEMLAALDGRTSPRIAQAETVSTAQEERLGPRASDPAPERAVERPRVSRETERAPAPRTTRRAPAVSSASERVPERATEQPRVSRETEPEVRRSTPNVAKAPASTPPPAATTSSRSTSAPVSAELVARSQAVLAELLSHLGVQCQVASLPSPDPALISLGVQGEESSALLIGKHGQTLDAIEYLLNRIVVRDSGSATRIEVDVEGYRARREQSLIATARRMAGKVRETGKPATVEAMNPRDRRIVHMALKDETGVTSRSQGDGFLRKLVIVPAGGRRRNEPRSTRDGE
jgi:spoIIIJ-associated protein